MSFFVLSLTTPLKANLHRIPRLLLQPSACTMPKRRISATTVVRAAVDSSLDADDGPAPSKKARNGKAPIILNASSKPTETGGTDSANGSDVVEGLKTPTK